MSAPDAHADRSELGVDERGQCYALTDTGHAALAATGDEEPMPLARHQQRPRRPDRTAA